MPAWKFYVSKFDVGSGKPEFVEASVFPLLEDAMIFLVGETRNLEPGIELSLGCGVESDDWFPANVKQGKQN